MLGDLVQGAWNVARTCQTATIVPLLLLRAGGVLRARACSEAQVGVEVEQESRAFVLVVQVSERRESRECGVGAGGGSGPES